MKPWILDDMNKADTVAMAQCDHWIDAGISSSDALASLGIIWPRRYTTWALVNSCLMELWLDMAGLQR